LRRLFMQYARPPFVIADRFDPDALTRHLLGA
jgi:hypothetical protein